MVIPEQELRLGQGASGSSILNELDQIPVEDLHGDPELSAGHAPLQHHRPKVVVDFIVDTNGGRAR